MIGTHRHRSDPSTGGQSPSGQRKVEAKSSSCRDDLVIKFGDEETVVVDELPPCFDDVVRHNMGIWGFGKSSEVCKLVRVRGTDHRINGAGGSNIRRRNHHISTTCSQSR
jgi:hypothetical protein